jgi:hypothetical protein
MKPTNDVDMLFILAVMAALIASSGFSAAGDFKPNIHGLEGVEASSSDVPLWLERRGGNIIQLTAAIAGFDRQDLKDYSRKNHEDLWDYSATGMIDCYGVGGLAGTGQIVKKKGANTTDVVITSAHLFFTKSCEMVDTSKCYFVPLFDPGRKIHFRALPENIGGCVFQNYNSNIDWAVIELNESLPKMRPYLIHDKDVEIKNHVKLTQVSAFSTNFPGKRGVAVDCETRDVNRINISPLITTCSSGNGASGSALLVKKRGRVNRLEYWLYGIESSSPYVAADGNPYNFDGDGPRNYDIGVPLSGKFLERLNAVLDAKRMSND